PSAGQKICRRGTERPCYKVSYIHDSRRRLTFEDASRACRVEGGELLSIETESEQRLVERFIHQLQAADGDFWIGLRRSPERYPAGASPVCPSQYYWLDGSKAKYRNWHWDEPSCGGEMCVVLYYQPSAPPDEDGRFLFQWNDNNCNSKNNFVCKYSEGDLLFSFSTVASLRPALSSTTEANERMKMGLTETVSASERLPYASPILYGTLPALLLLLIAAAGFLSYKHRAKRRKTQTDGSRSKPQMGGAVSPYAVQGPYAFSDISKLDAGPPADVETKYPGLPPQHSQCNDYENVPGPERESCFVTNDIYESSKAQGRSGRSGWVENEIYG
uniref:Layilin b n=2 Tax=Tetraodon nigroviridis TaxID=99883 RepID=H3CQR1_TETNG